MKNAMWLIVVALGGYAAYKAVTGIAASTGLPGLAPGVPAPAFKLLLPLPPGGTLTGRIQTTDNARPPNYTEEVSGFGAGQWAEVVSPNGRKDWIPIATS
ncbi:MAG: hypothetical protein GZ088_09745 [Acidipila sp.]|nr:hypothetical protein [Acidipila sp.]